MRERRHDVDWLRVLAMLVVFLFHSARFFDDDGWHLKNDQLCLPIELFNGFADLWTMPILFVVAGSAAWFSLRSRRAGQKPT